MPAQGAGSKITFLGVRSVDTQSSPVNKSRIVPPAPLLAQEIVEPVAPEEPLGPTFATRPDFYGKSTYTFNIKLNDTTSGRRPFGFIFYRSDERKILDTLYLPATVATVITDMTALRASNESDFVLAWQELVNGTTDSNELFPLHGTFRFPIPDNNTYTVPNRDASIIVHPFNGTTPPGSTTVIPNTNGQTMHDIVLDAIDGAFLPLTEQPAIYKYLNGGVQTSAKKPVYRDANGDLVTPVLPTDPQYDPEVFNPFPMAVQYSKNSSGTILFPNQPNYNDNANDFFVRFTDYKIDGAANNFYFYFAVELTNKLKVSGRSPVKGPVFLVNAAPAEQPGIRKVTSQLANPTQNIPTAVLFELNPYNASEGITRFGLFRAINANDALTVRTMDFVKFVDVGDPIVDDFPNIPFPLFGEALFYRIVAYRQIKNETGQIEYIPSKPSNTALSSVVDNVNPSAPKIRSINGNTTSTQLQNVILKWEPTGYNAKYTLQVQAENGSWRDIYSIKSNGLMQYPPLDQNNQPDFTNYPETATLERFDANGDKIRHAYRVRVVNSSGLLNLTERELVLDQGDGDLLNYDSFVSLVDGNGFTQNPFVGGDVTYQNFRQPTTLTFQDITDPLPAGHNQFNGIDVQVTDDLGNSFTKTIQSFGGSVTFNHGDGGLILDSTNPNRVYNVRSTLRTNTSTLGANKQFTLAYVSGPCYDLKSITSLLKFTDSTHVIQPLLSGEIDDGVAYPGFITLQDISNLATIGQSLDHIDVTLRDNFGNFDTKLLAPSGNITFNNGDGGLQLDQNNPNGTYRLTAKIFTTQCSAGSDIQYELTYVFQPCSALLQQTSIAGFNDGNGINITPLTTSSIGNYSSPNGQITIQDLIGGQLPSGVNFTKMDVVLQDNLGHHVIKTINTVNGSVTFQDGEAGLVLTQLNTGRRYTISIVVTTSVCAGATFSYSISYQQ